MNNKIFLIIGKSFSGKDTLLKDILGDKEFCEENNLHKLVRYTTRLKRPDEIDDDDYHFISNDEFKKIANNSSMVITSFNSDFGLLHYITDFSELEDGKNYILSGDPDMIFPYRKIVGLENLYVIFLLPPNYTLFERFSVRNDNEEYSDKKFKEIYRRFIDDSLKFYKYSNMYLCHSTCLLNVGKTIYMDTIKNEMKNFIINNYRRHGLVLTKDKILEFSTLYTPNYDALNPLEITIQNDTDLLKILDKIIILNGNIIIQTESESYKYHDNTHHFISETEI